MKIKSIISYLFTDAMRGLAISLWTIGSVALGQDFLDPNIAYKLALEGKATLIDVREMDEIELGMAASALWFPLSKAQKKGEELEAFLMSLSKEKLIVVYCRSGKRAGVFVSILQEKGYKAANMGAFSDWVKAHLPVCRPVLRQVRSGQMDQNYWRGVVPTDSIQANYRECPAVEDQV